MHFCFHFHPTVLSEVPAYLYRGHLCISSPTEARKFPRIIAKPNFLSLDSSTIFNLKLHVMQIRKKIIFFRPFKEEKELPVIYDLHLRAKSSGREMVYWWLRNSDSIDSRQLVRGMQREFSFQRLLQLLYFFLYTLDRYGYICNIIEKLVFKETSQKILLKYKKETAQEN